MSASRASSVSRAINVAWMDREEFPLVEQMGPDMVLIEGGWRSLGLAADILAAKGGYHIVHDGQWVDDLWMPWLEVREGSDP